ncbi:hypothetical protein HLI_15905 [Halobacillus litoralis]|uniref:Uncharacterized protein n=1 Tax=Halobacillus litoralis TaxID=45668 RepID=A0A410MFV9_9BACI|nr:hypothetical protein HLI_15905 [Halobacillus litoralis]
MTPAGTARAEDPFGQVFFLTKLAEAVPAASIHRQAIREKQQTLTYPLIDSYRKPERKNSFGFSSGKFFYPSLALF